MTNESFSALKNNISKKTSAFFEIIVIDGQNWQQTSKKNSTLCKIDLPRSRGCEVGIWSKRRRIIGRSKSSKSTMLTSTQSRFVDFLHLQQLYPFSRICQSTHFTTKMGSFFLLSYFGISVVLRSFPEKIVKENGS